MLDWLSDLGGLMDVLYFSASYVLAPLLTFRLQSALSSHIFRFKKSEPEKIRKYRPEELTAQEQKNIELEG